MRTHHRRLAASLLAAAAVALPAACDDFITGETLTENPNAPTTATALQLLVAAQVSLFNQQEGQLARLASMYTQQLSGTNNQQRDYGSFYALTEGDVNNFWSQNFGGGGLLDLRRVQAQARAGGDARTQGIAMVLEALRVGTVASLWGDVPYSEAAAETPAPKLDPQREVYAAVQRRLDSAIVLLGGGGAGPASADVIYQGDARRWTRAANTLKARFHLHTAERLGATAYQAALAAAQAGIDEAPTSAAQAMHGQAPGDLRSAHGGTVDDGNVWAQFLGNRADMTANQQFVDLLRRRGDPRLAEYLDPAGDGQYRGATQFGVVPREGASVVDVPTRRALAFRQPIVTWAENELILAEARFRLGAADAALGHVNAVRRAVGLAPLAGPVTLEQIMEEKYVALFQNIEAYNDYKRTCFPRVTPGGQGGTPAREVPARLPYAVAERNANPNVPAPNAAPARNWNDPEPCP